MSQKQSKFKKLINDIHLWLGLGAGIILFIVCLSGTIYTFRSEIEYLVNPDKYNAASHQPGQNPMETEILISNLQKQEKGKIISVVIPENHSKNYQFGLIKKKTEDKTSVRPKLEIGSKAGSENQKISKGNKSENRKAEGEIVDKGGKDQKPQRSRPTIYYVDPYTGKIMGKDGDKTSQFFITMMKLHRWLLLDDSIGRPIVGAATIVFIFLSLSGLILWFPKKLKYWKRWFHWKPGFKIKYKANWKRLNHDLHNTLGFYSLIFLLIMAFTGLCWSFDWYKDGVSSIMGSEVFSGRNEKPIQLEKSKNSMISFSQIDSISIKALPYEGDMKINLPKDSTSALTIYKNKTGFFALSASDKLNINPYTGKVLSIDIFREKPLNVQIVSLIKPLHLGDVFGTFSKIIYFITCLVGTSLPITGVFVWINKMKKKKKAAKIIDLS